ncbi:PilW family protein [Desulfoluna sp.]|uniref:PilW family protein n=1 Tax=Desulfoluna sp. TaxID=2045199 RepID=UPI00261C4456|nr:PilW family protein [Desulfoluna sp.]
MNVLTCRKGFTLLELLVAVALSMIIITAGYFFYSTEIRTRVTQERVTDMQQNLRAAMVMMGTDLRMAGYDPEGTTDAGFTAASAATATFTSSVEAEANGHDDDGDGVVDEADEASRPMTLETFSYELKDEDTDGDLDLVRIVGANRVAIAENIEALELNYVLDDGTTASAPADLKRIVAVRIALLARSRTEDPGFSNGAKYQGYAKTWNAFNDGYRRRLLRRTVRCRNRGIE